VVRLQSSGDPYAIYRDVDGGDKGGSANHDHLRASSVRNNNSDTIDDNLQQKLHLDTPPEDFIL
jgi:hypothetical protein